MTTYDQLMQSHYMISVLPEKIVWCLYQIDLANNSPPRKHSEFIKSPLNYTVVKHMMPLYIQMIYFKGTLWRKHKIPMRPYMDLFGVNALITLTQQQKKKSWSCSWWRYMCEWWMVFTHKYSCRRELKSLQAATLYIIVKEIILIAYA